MDNNSNILFVDAEQSMLESIKRFVLDFGKNAFYATNINEAMNIVNNNNIDVLFVDITRDNLIELLEMVQEAKPKIVKVVISDFAHLSMIINSIRKLNLHSFLLKPWKKQELIDTISSAEDYAKFLKLQTKEKENLEQKNVIYQRIINFKDDVGESNKIDINSLKSSMFILASEYEKLLKNPDGKNLELALRSLYNASEIYTASFPSFVEKFVGLDIVKSISLANTTIEDETDGAEFIKNLSLIKEFISRTCKYISNFMGTNSSKVVISKVNEKDIKVSIEADYNWTCKNELVLFFEYLKNIYNTNNVKLHHEIYDEGNIKVYITL
ncbi:MAG: response regulator [Clostridia bacterium]|nr:response regulator [Clostridia bacterium]